MGRVRNFCAPEHSHGKLICALPVAYMGKDQLDGSHENKCVTTCRVSPQFTFLFSPFYKYGACSSAQDGGYLNVGTFKKQVDPTNGLSLVQDISSCFGCTQI